MAVLRSLNDSECRFSAQVLEMQVRCCSPRHPDATQTVFIRLDTARTPLAAEDQRGALLYLTPEYFFEHALVVALVGDDVAELEEVERIANELANAHNERLPALVADVYRSRNPYAATTFKTGAGLTCLNVLDCIERHRAGVLEGEGVGRVTIRIRDPEYRLGRDGSLIPIQQGNPSRITTFSQIGREMGLSPARVPLPPPSVFAMGSEIDAMARLSSTEDLFNFDRAMRRTIDGAGFPPYALLTVGDEGLLYVSPLERIERESGRPFEGVDRFSTEKRECRFSWNIRLIWRCLNAPDQRTWRIFVFGLADDVLATGLTSEDQGRYDSARIIAMSRQPSSPLPAAANGLRRPALLQILIYELDKEPGEDTPIRRVDARRSAEAHLTSAHFLEALP